ncbi:hypothetical protein [Paenibacillus sp. UNC451MF]|uniref:hypothetical protein n=1 Tax=Paenibacillus sp. UNC451MF TaxID=1449063 RepID=UPI00055D5432|nr:hypothetical protein [Paenibacillus sp. UNC451MF]
MILSELWRLYETDKRIQGFSPSKLKAYALQLKMLVRETGENSMQMYIHIAFVIPTRASS